MPTRKPGPEIYLLAWSWPAAAAREGRGPEQFEAPPVLVGVDFARRVPPGQRLLR
jgi:hypothetical protein